MCVYFSVCSSRASAAVNNLKRFHEKKKKGLKPHSLYLDHIIRKSVSSHNRRESHSRSHRDIYVIKVNMNMLQVLTLQNVKVVEVVYLLSHPQCTLV